MAAPDDPDEIAKSKRPQTFPRLLEGQSIAAMEEYLGALQTEILRVKLEIEKRGGMKHAAESLFRKAD